MKYFESGMEDHAFILPALIKKKKKKEKNLNLYSFVDYTISYTLFEQDLPCHTKQEYLLLIHNIP